MHIHSNNLATGTCGNYFSNREINVAGFRMNPKQHNRVSRLLRRIPYLDRSLAINRGNFISGILRREFTRVDRDYFNTKIGVK